jgi:hypothetical protein
MDGLLDRTAHYRVGPKPTRDEMHERYSGQDYGEVRVVNPFLPENP